jgi:protein-L-isoaspartate(D-aspartate) O-methyltransferase
MRSNVELIGSMIVSGVLKTPRIIEAFEEIDRCRFVPLGMHDLCYIDKPLPIGEEQTISQPSTVAFMLELLGPQKGDRVLDIGSGSGWATALLCHIVGLDGGVTGLERIESLVEQGSSNLSQFGFGDRCRIERAGISLGIPGERFNRILVSASAKSLPVELIDQLLVGGVLVIPVQNDIMRIIRTQDGYTKESHHGFVFVPLVVE